MTTLKRCLLIALFFQIGCVALDHTISELEYEEDDLRLLVGNSFPNDGLNLDEESQGEFGLNDVISFHPKLYDFNESPVGMPRLGLVRIDNRLKDENVKLISISGNTINFHSSFFADKVLGPGNSTSFEVVFVSREEGQFESVLFIHTSKGLFKYYVKGTGLPNPYRLRPLVGARIPVNGSYEPIITLHNPHDTRILVVEMLSSGTDFGLKLPSETNDNGDDGAAWAIEPFQTKSVMQGSFQGKTEGNHTGFIRIKVNHTSVSGEYLMVPVEVQVSSSPGIYFSQESLDFGLIVRSDKPKTLSLNLINAQNNPVNIQSVSVQGDANPAIRIEFRPVVAEPDSSASIVVALITFDPYQVHTSDQTSGFIEVKSECGKSITIPFTATVLEGELEYNMSSLGFFVNGDNMLPRNFSVRNKFLSSVAIYQVTVSHPEIIEVGNLNQSHVITPGEQKTICTLTLQRIAALCDSATPIELTVKSNITNLKFPITCYDGKLQLYTVENGQVEFGKVELYSTSTEYIAVQNTNPIEVRLKSWGSNSSWSQVELVGMQMGVMEDLTKIRDFDNLKKSLFLQPGYMAVFSIEIRRPTVEGMYYGESYVSTDQNQTLRTPFRFMVSRGLISSESIFFDKVFPGKISSEKLYLTSTFNQTQTIVGIRSLPPSIVWFSPSNSEIYPHRRNYVGKLHYDPRKFCPQNHCYAGFSLDSQVGQDWKRGTLLDSETGAIDLKILNMLKNQYNEIRNEIVSNISIWVDTSGSTGFKIKAKVRYTWPRLSIQKSWVFPLTSLGNETTVDVVIHNPANSPVIFHAAMSYEYGRSWKNFVTDGSSVGNGNATDLGHVFSIQDILYPSSHSIGDEDADIKNKFRKFLPDGTQTSKKGFFFLVPPSTKVSLVVKFSPISKELASSLLLLRNNLTGVETVLLTGRAGTGQLTVGNGTPGSSLLFQLTENLLHGCEKEGTTKYLPPQVTVRRSFIARNIGEIPLDVVSLQIFPQHESLWYWLVGNSDTDKAACEGYGFRILNCHPFTIQPNQTHSIDIAFTPDFTLSKVRATLRLADSIGGNFNYTLVSLVPSSMLTKCAGAIARPWWEWYMKLGTIIGSVIIFLVASCILYFEASGIISKTVLATVRVLPRGSTEEISPEEISKTQRLDLKSVYEKVENRFKKNEAQKLHSASNATKPQKQNDQSGQNLRNRKTKKNCTELYGSHQNGNSNKVMEKINNNCNFNRPVVPVNANVEDVLATYMKKDKESSNTPGTTSKKKKGTNNHSTNQANGKLKQYSKIEVFNSSSLQSKKLEEETSSTTTESSNPDDTVPYFEPYEKDRKQKGINCNEQKKPKSSKSEKKTSSTDNVSSSESTYGMEKSLDDKKKGSGKQIETFGPLKDGLEPQLRQGNVTSMWDSPRPSSGDGFSEFAAQTEAFVMQQPCKRSNSIGDGSQRHGNITPNTQNNGNLGFHKFNAGLSQSPFTIPTQRPQRQGHGQTRPPLAMFHSQSNFGSHHPNSMSQPIATSGYNFLTNYTAPGCTRSQITTPSGSIWDSEVFPDNGCDLWGRRHVDAASPPGYFNISSENSFPRPSNIGYGTQNGFDSSSSTPSIPYSDPYNPSRPLQTHPPSTTINSGSSSNMGSFYQNKENDSYLGRFSSDPTSSPWHINPPPFNDLSLGYRSQQKYGTGQSHSPIGLHSTTSSGIPQHVYLQRMRSDPTMRSQQQQQPLASSSATSRPPWIDSVFTDNGSSRRESEERESSNWLSSPQASLTTSLESSLEEWRAVGPSGTRVSSSQESQIWDANAVGSGRWPSSSSSVTPVQNNFLDSMAVGSGARLPSTTRQEESTGINSLGDIGLCGQHSAEISREVEAGLGFNPFKTNIWDQSDGSSWGSFSYNKK